MGQAASAPLINDVATDLADPPIFTKSSHSATLSDKTAIAAAYPDLVPVKVPNRSVAEVLAAAKAVAATALPRASVVYDNEAEGALELLDITAIMRFKDDVAVRWVAGLVTLCPSPTAALLTAVEIRFFPHYIRTETLSVLKTSTNIIQCLAPLNSAAAPHWHLQKPRNGAASLHSAPPPHTNPHVGLPALQDTPRGRRDCRGHALRLTRGQRRPGLQRGPHSHLDGCSQEGAGAVKPLPNPPLLACTAGNRVLQSGNRPKRNMHKACLAGTLPQKCKPQNMHRMAAMPALHWWWLAQKGHACKRLPSSLW